MFAHMDKRQRRPILPGSSDRYLGRKVDATAMPVSVRPVNIETGLRSQLWLGVSLQRPASEIEYSGLEARSEADMVQSTFDEVSNRSSGCLTT